MNTTHSETGPNFSDIRLNDEIGQPTYVELIAVSKESGRAIRTICDEATGELTCDEGSPPSASLRSLAYGKPKAKASIISNTQRRVVAANEIVTVTAQYTPNSSPQKLNFRSNRSISNFRELVANHAIATSVPTSQAGDRFYFAFPNGIYVSNSITGGTLTLLVAGSGNAVDLALDTNNGFIYWCEADYIDDFNENAIYRTKLDGSEKQRIADLDFIPYGIWLDAEDLYCTTGPSTEPQIVRINVNLSSIIKIGDADIPNLGLTGLRGPVNLQYNPLDSLVYYAGYGLDAPHLPGGIYKMNVLNGAVVKVVDTNDNALIQGPSGVALVIDPLDDTNSRIYFTTTGNSPPGERNSKVWRVKLDGTNLEVLPNLPPGLGLPTDIVYDQAARKLYITDTAYGWLTLNPDPRVAVITYDIDSGIFEVVLFNNQPNEALLSRRAYETQALTGISINYTETDLPEIPESICGSGYNLIKDANFNADRNGWVGGTLDIAKSAITNNIGIPKQLNSSTEKSLYDSIIRVEQTFTTLLPGYKARLEITFGTVERTGDPSADSQLIYTMTPYNSVGVSLPVDGLSGYVGNIYQFGVATIETTVPPDGIIRFEIVVPTYVNFTVNTGETRLIEIDNIRLCSRLANITTVNCEEIYDISSLIQWDGTIRQPINFFEAFVRYKLRDPDDPTKFGFVYQPPIKTTQFSGCDIWKQQGNGGVAEDNPLASTNLVAGNIASIGLDTNWIWASSADTTTTGQNFAKTTFWSPEVNTPERRVEGDRSCTRHDEEAEYKKCIVESITLYKLVNKIGGAGVFVYDARTGSNCLPDPTSEFNITLEYKRKPISSPKSRSFTQTKNISDLYESSAEIFNNWYSGSLIGVGVPGLAARWEAFTFVLDTPSGNGIDQCSPITSTEYTGSGEIITPAASIISGSNFFAEPCIPSVLIETLEDGILSNDIQNVILPNPTGGSYRLRITINNDQQITEDVPYNATSGQLQIKIGALSNVGGTRNVGVTGSGTSLDPFIIEFRDLLQAVDVAPITVDVSNLTGTASAAVATLRNGTTNERQKLTKDNSYQSYFISFNGSTTQSLPFNASLNSIQAAVESLDTIGVGNISVTGATSDRDAPYTSSIIYFDFIGDFAGQNVPLMVVDSIGDYVVTTEWNGGGVDEIQEVIINATAGSFKLTFADPSDDSSATTDNISWLSSATTLKESIISSISWLQSDNLIVTKPSNNKWNLRFTGNLNGINIKQIEIDGSLLRGGSAVIATLQEAAYVGDKQRVTLVNATGGVFQLGVKNPKSGGIQKTTEIQYNATAAELQGILEGLTWLSPGSVAVSGKSPSWIISFDPKFGNIDRMLSTVDDLICDPAAIRPIPEPPYQYEIPRPGLGSPLPEASPLEPLRDSANVYNRKVFQRDLFDPNKKVNGSHRTVLQLALIKSYDPEYYNPYIRSCDNTKLSEVSYTRIAKTQESYVLIAKEIDSETERRRILQYLSTNQEILPFRFSWDCLG